MSGLRFDELQAANMRRCVDVFHNIDDWSETDWACAIAGEVGEALNLIKKRRRLITSHRSLYAQEGNMNSELHVNRVVDELADAVIYIDLLCTRMGVSLEDGIRRKFETVTQRTNSSVHLPH